MRIKTRKTARVGRREGKGLSVQELVIRKPDDMHLHLRDGDMMTAVTPYTSRDYCRAIIMPNLVPPVVTAAAAASYRQRILAAVPEGQRFEPLMTLYLTEAMAPDEIDDAVDGGFVKGVKLYPAGATTNSASGVRDIEKVKAVLERMAERGLPLLVHGEVTDLEIDIFDREAVFIDRILTPLRNRLPTLKVVLEHITTKQGIEYVRTGPGYVAGTLTAHHLVLNRNALFRGGIRPHYYCLPILKREEHRVALVEAALSGNARFFLGTDSAPHPTSEKEAACGCAGVFSAPNALALLATLFEQEGVLDRLECFTSLHGAAFYELPPNEERVRLVKSDEVLGWPETVTVGSETVTVFDPGCPIPWRVVYS